MFLMLRYLREVKSARFIALARARKISAIGTISERKAPLGAVTHTTRLLSHSILRPKSTVYEIMP
jgi:hypothetical protein